MLRFLSCLAVNLIRSPKLQQFYFTEEGLQILASISIMIIDQHLSYLVVTLIIYSSVTGVKFLPRFRFLLQPDLPYLFVNAVQQLYFILCGF